jgi:threonylcarbamoyladenosine tRNA methylthiotransferase MtaB
MKRKVAFKTIGCRLNQFETDSIATHFYKTGYDIVPFSEEADVYVINTCTVTNQGDHKSKYAINQAVRKKKGSVVVVTGCMAESQKQYLESRGDISYVIGNKTKSSIVPLVEAHFNGEMLFPDAISGDVFDFHLVKKGFHTRSMIKIQDGCNNFCTFCIVPLVRGRAISRPVNDILDNIRKIIQLDYKEIVLTGVNISRYNCDGTDFTGLLNKILSLLGNFRVRISSIEPEGLGKRFYELFSHEKLCPHLHLCLQSGSDRILMKMRRMYNLSAYLEIIDQIKMRYPLFNFTTDIMVGFPEETDADFEATCSVVRQVGFSHVHTFKYSVRHGTRAERMSGHVPEKIKQQRSKIIHAISDENKLQYRSLLLCKTETILVEKHTGREMVRGFGEHYVPVEFKALQTGTNYFEKVKITGTGTAENDFLLKGEISPYIF